MAVHVRVDLDGGDVDMDLDVAFGELHELVGIMSSKDAIALGWTGPTLRSTGVPYDVRKVHPYMTYDQYEFDVPVGSTGDNDDRFMCRQAEMRESARIIGFNHPSGPFEALTRKAAPIFQADGPPDMGAIMKLAAEHEVEVLGPPLELSGK